MTLNDHAYNQQPNEAIRDLYKKLDDLIDEYQSRPRDNVLPTEVMEIIDAAIEIGESF